MMRIFNTVDGQTEQIATPVRGSWVSLVDPSDMELSTVSQNYNIDLADLRAPLDDEERSRTDVEDTYTMVIASPCQWW